MVRRITTCDAGHWHVVMSVSLRPKCIRIAALKSLGVRHDPTLYSAKSGEIERRDPEIGNESGRAEGYQSIV